MTSNPYTPPNVENSNAVAPTPPLGDLQTRQLIQGQQQIAFAILTYLGAWPLVLLVLNSVRDFWSAVPYMICIMASVSFYRALVIFRVSKLVGRSSIAMWLGLTQFLPLVWLAVFFYISQRANEERLRCGLLKKLPASSDNYDSV